MPDNTYLYALFLYEAYKNLLHKKIEEDIFLLKVIFKKTAEIRSVDVLRSGNDLKALNLMTSNVITDELTSP